MIRLATIKDSNLINQRLSELENPPLNPDIPSILRTPEEIVFVDDVKDIVGRVSVNKETRSINIVWLLPASEDKKILIHIVLACFKEVVKRFPKCASWKVYAVFTTGRGCLKDFTNLTAAKQFCDDWQKFFPNTATTKPILYVLGLSWKIEGSRMDDIIADAEATKQWLVD